MLVEEDRNNGEFTEENGEIKPLGRSIPLKGCRLLSGEDEVYIPITQVSPIYLLYFKIKGTHL